MGKWVMYSDEASRLFVKSVQADRRARALSVRRLAVMHYFRGLLSLHQQDGVVRTVTSVVRSAP